MFLSFSGFSKWPRTQRPGVRTDPGARVQPTSQLSVTRAVYVCAFVLSCRTVDLGPPALCITVCALLYCIWNAFMEDISYMLPSKLLPLGLLGLYHWLWFMRFCHICAVKLVFLCGRNVWWVVSKEKTGNWVLSLSFD